MVTDQLSDNTRVSVWTRRLGVWLAFVFTATFLGISSPAILVTVLWVTGLCTIYASFLVKDGSDVDIGISWGTPPLAKFYICRKRFRVHLIPCWVQVNDDMHPGLLFVSACTLLIVSFILGVCAFMFDGCPNWISPQGESISVPLTGQVSIDSSGMRVCTKVVHIDSGSEAARVGLKYGDILVDINGVNIRSVKDAIRAFANSEDRTDLTVRRSGQVQNLTFGRATRDQLYGFMFGPALELNGLVIAERVAYGGRAYRTGIHPGAILQYQKGGALLSRGSMEFVKHLDPNGFLKVESGFSCDITGKDVGDIFIAWDEMGNDWEKSVALCDGVTRRSVGISESMFLTASLMVHSIPLVPRRGHHLTSEASRFSLGFSPFWRIGKVAFQHMTYLGSLFILCALFRKWSLLGMFGWFLWILGACWLHLSFVDKLMVWRSVLPFSDLFRNWGV